MAFLPGLRLLSLEMKRHNLYLPDELVEEARKLAQDNGISLADVIRAAIEKYLQAVKRSKEARNGPR